MKLKDFLNVNIFGKTLEQLVDDGISGKVTKINDDNLGRLATGTAAQIIYGFADWRKSGYSYSRLWNKEVVSFEYNDNELYVQVK